MPGTIQYVEVDDRITYATPHADDATPYRRADLAVISGLRISDKHIDSSLTRSGGYVAHAASVRGNISMSAHGLHIRYS